MKEICRKCARFWEDEEGIGTLEILLIVAAIVIIAIAFRNYIVEWVKNLLSDTNDKLNERPPEIEGP